MQASQLVKNETFIYHALFEALKVLSNDSGIAVESLIKQLPTNKQLQTTAAQIVADVAKLLESENNSK